MRNYYKTEYRAISPSLFLPYFQGTEYRDMEYSFYSNSKSQYLKNHY